jgi:hypothetical protein
MPTEEPIVLCHACDCDISDDSMIGVDENDYCYDCWSERYGYCHDCDEQYPIEDLRSCEDGMVCVNCQDDDDVTYVPVRQPVCADYSKVGSPRCYGVEIETDECPGHASALRNSVWGAKNDCSVNGKEFFSSILSGNAGLEAIAKIAAVARRNRWNVDDNCGLHVHFDMRDESSDGIKAIALAYLLSADVWSQFVAEERRDNHYCGENRTDIAELYGVDNFYYWAGNQSRYCWINFAAYYSHRTLEVRSHQGTCNEKEICNWVRAHAIFMDWAARVGWAKVRNMFLTADTAGRTGIIAGIWADAGADDLIGYYKDKAECYATEDSCCDNW